MVSPAERTSESPVSVSLRPAALMLTASSMDREMSSRISRTRSVAWMD